MQYTWITLYIYRLMTLFLNEKDNIYRVRRLWCLTPLPAIFQLYRGGQFYWWSKPE